MRLAASPVPVSSSSNSLIAPPSISFAAGAHAIGLWKDAVELTRLDRVAGRGEPGDHPGPCLLLGRARRTALLLLLREIRRVRRHQYSQPEGCRRGKPSADLAPFCVKGAVVAPWSLRRRLSPSRSFVRWGA